MGNPYIVNPYDYHKYNKKTMRTLRGAAQPGVSLFKLDDRIFSLHSIPSRIIINTLIIPPNLNIRWEVAYTNHSDLSVYTYKTPNYLPESAINACLMWVNNRFDMSLPDFLYKTLGKFDE